MTYRHTQVGYWMFVVSVVLALATAARAQSLTAFGVMVFITTLASCLSGYAHHHRGRCNCGREVRPDRAHSRTLRGRRHHVSASRAQLAAPRHRHALHPPWPAVWNVWGLDAVELQLRNGTRFRIGTDQPQELLNALRRSGVTA